MNIGFQLRSNLKGEEKVLDKQKEVLFRAMVMMENLARDKAPRAFGELRRRIHLTPDMPGHVKYILSDGVNYGIYLEEGTRPHWVPIEPLKDWAQHKFQDESIAYAVRWKIHQKGTKKRPYFIPAKNEVQRVWLPIIWRQVHGVA